MKYKAVREWHWRRGEGEREEGSREFCSVLEGRRDSPNKTKKKKRKE